MSTGACEVTPERYALPAVVLAFVTAGMKKKRCVRQNVEERISVSPLPPDIFGDSRSFVVVLA